VFREREIKPNFGGIIDKGLSEASRKKFLRGGEGDGFRLDQRMREPIQQPGKQATSWGVLEGNKQLK